MKTVYQGQSKKSGVYKIINTTNNRIYIGSAKRFKSRLSHHLVSLRKGTHHNKFLQHDFNKCGEDAFEFHVLEVVAGEQFNRLLVEQTHIDKFYDKQSQCYNFKSQAKAKSRSCFSKTPEETSKLISSNSKAMWENPKHKKAMAKKAKARWKDPEYRKKCSVGHASPMSESRKQELAERMKQKWQDPEFKAKMAKKISDTLKNKLKNDSEFQEKTRQNLARGPESLRRQV